MSTERLVKFFYGFWLNSRRLPVPSAHLKLDTATPAVYPPMIDLLCSASLPCFSTLGPVSVFNFEIMVSGVTSGQRAW